MKHPLILAFLTLALTSANLYAQQSGSVPEKHRDSVYADSVAIKKQRGESWLKEAGRWQDYTKIRDLLAKENIYDQFRRKPPNPTHLYSAVDDITQDISVLYDYSEILELRTRGVDVVQSFFFPQKNDLNAALYDFSEVVLVVEVMGANTWTGTDDGYASTVKLKVVEVLKGENVSDSILVRQKTGQVSMRRIRVALHENELVSYSDGKFLLSSADRRYLIYASSKLYPLAITRNGKSPVTGQGEIYMLRISPIRLKGDTIVRGQGSAVWWDQAPKSLDQVRDICNSRSKDSIYIPKRTIISTNN